MIDEIESVEEIGELETYDLTVDHPKHTFFANGVSVSNCSHATAYAIDSYWCAWLLTYYEEEWLSAYLESMSSSPQGKAEAANYVRQMGYQIVPIDINHAGLGWTVLPGKRLMPSLTSCKGVGVAAAQEIISLRPFTSIEQMLWDDSGKWRLSKFTRKAFEALIKVGAFGSLDCVGADKVFKSYRHMGEVMLGSYTEPVTRKRRGVVSTVEAVREHANLIKRSSKQDPHEGRRNFFDLARGLAADFGAEWSRKELVEFKVEYFSSADITMLFEPQLLDKLAEKEVSPIDDLDVGQKKLVWFVTTSAVPKKGQPAASGVMRKTKTGKSYVQAFVIGLTGTTLKLNVWSAKQLFEPFHLYAAQVERNDMGYSTVLYQTKELA